MLKAIIFDFDGTLIKNLPTIVEILRLHGKEYGVRLGNIERYRGMTLPQLLKHFRISIWKAAFLVHKLKKEVRARTPTTPFVVGMQSVITDFGKQCSVGIITSNKRKNVEHVLHRERIAVRFIVADSPLFGKSRVIRRTLWKHGWRADEVVYVGDEVRDVEACREAGVTCIAVTWGYNNRKAFSRVQPAYTVDKQAQLRALLSRLFAHARKSTRLTLRQRPG